MPRHSAATRRLLFAGAFFAGLTTAACTDNGGDASKEPTGGTESGPQADVDSLCAAFLPVYMKYRSGDWSLDSVYGAMYIVIGSYPDSQLSMSEIEEGTLGPSDLTDLAAECEQRSDVDFPTS